MSRTKRSESAQKKQVTFVNANANDDLLENPMIVQKVDILTANRNIHNQSLQNTQLRRSSITQGPLPIKTNDDNTKIKFLFNNTNTIQPTINRDKEKIILPVINNIKENKSEYNPKIPLNRSDALNDTITSEFGTFNLNKPEFRTNENQPTLDLLARIRRIPKAIAVGPMPLSPQGCRFELPFDLKLLETLTPLDYLSKYCRLSPRRKYQFKRIFDKYRNTQYRFESSYLYLSILDIHKENFSHTKYNSLCQLIDLDNHEYQFTFETYAGILAFCERMLFNSSTLGDGYDDYYLTKHIIETCDFDGLNRKLDGLVISEAMKRLLNSL